MALGVPCLAFENPDGISATCEGTAGFLYGGKVSLEAAITQAYDDRSRFPEIKIKLREAAVQRHSWSTRVRQMLDKLAPILGNAAESTSETRSND